MDVLETATAAEREAATRPSLLEAPTFSELVKKSQADLNE